MGSGLKTAWYQNVAYISVSGTRSEAREYRPAFITVLPPPMKVNRGPKRMYSIAKRLENHRTART